MDREQQMCLVVLLVFCLTVSQSVAEVLNHSDKTVNRDWGPWTGWSVCSQTCGYGTVFRIRQCHTHNQRQVSGLVCKGPSQQYKICIFKNCTEDEADYRTSECSKHNNALYGQKTFTWIPYINNASPCELSCKSVESEYYARFQKTVADFVICNEENTALCIQGQCVKSGCDGILDSGTKVDICGICAGDGTTCRFIHGIFTRTHLTHHGYNIITTIPEGARNINITEMSRSRNHLALSTVSGYFLNGDLRLQSEGQVKGAGTTFNYARGAGQSCPGECLTAHGPTNMLLRVELIYFSHNPGIYYQYTIPREKTNAKDKLTTNTSSSLDASVDPNIIKANLIPRIRQGKSPMYLPDTETKKSIQHRSTVSTPMTSDYEDVYESNHPPRYQSSDILSNQDKLYAEFSQLNDAKHPNSHLRELIDPASKVSAKVNSVNDVNRDSVYTHYYHTNEHDNIGDIPMIAALSEDNTEMEELNQYNGIRWLNRDSINVNRNLQLEINKQNQISARLTSHPSVIVDSRRNNQPTNQASPHRSSMSVHNTYNELDNMLPGHGRDQLYSWRITGFTDCSSSCGGGLQDTRIVCVKSDSQVEVMDENCGKNVKPESTTVVCNNQPCDSRWELGVWDVCSVTCGRGLQNRVVECKQRISPTLTMTVPPTACPQPQPPTKQYCQLDDCFHWRVSNWSKCSSECGFGQRSRTISCVDGTEQNVNDSFCIQDKPSLEEICDMGSCAQGWFHSKWSKQCSTECGRGYYTRQVYCSAADGSRLNEKKCRTQEKRPSKRKICPVIKPCGGQWFSGPWSQCNSTCGSDTYRQREVLCIKRHGKTLKQVVKEDNCQKDNKPIRTEHCGPFPECKPQWFVMSWTQCSKSCGIGVRTRDVKCLDVSFTPSLDCDKTHKPSRRETCNTQPCTEKDVPFFLPSITATNEALQMDRTDSTNMQPVCSDSQSSGWCQIAKQARLCEYIHYKTICCHTCNILDPKPL